MVRILAASFIISLAACTQEVQTDVPVATNNIDTETSQTSQASVISTPSLQLLWVATGLDAPEGAALAPDGSYFISNVNGSGREKDGNGYIIKLTPEGKYSGTPFATGLDAPKGMAVHDGALYVADIDRVVKFDAASGEKLSETVIEGAKFLNDMTVWKQRILVSDSGGASIYEVGDTSATLFAENQAFAGINGLLGSDGALWITTMKAGALITYWDDFNGSELLEIEADGMINADGLGFVPGGGTLVSAYSGQIYYVAYDGAVTKLLDEEANKIGQNDLSVFGDIVIVPNWGPGTVTAWRLVRN